MCVDYPPVAEALEQALGGTEHATVHADVLAEQKNGCVLRHGACQGRAHRLDQRQLGHDASASATAAPSTSRRCAASAAGSSA